MSILFLLHLFLFFLLSATLFKHFTHILNPQPSVPSASTPSISLAEGPGGRAHARRHCQSPRKVRTGTRREGATPQGGRTIGAAGPLLDEEEGVIRGCFSMKEEAMTKGGKWWLKFSSQLGQLPALFCRLDSNGFFRSTVREENIYFQLFQLYSDPHYHLSSFCFFLQLPAPCFVN